MKYFPTILIFLCNALSSVTAQKSDSIVTHNFTYHTQKAGEVYIVWTLNNWNDVADKKFWPEKSFLKDKMVWTRMQPLKDSFTVSISLPHKSYINYMFWVPIDRSGNSIDGWDTYGELFYSNLFLQSQRNSISDNGLWMPEKKKKKDFNILTSGWLVFSIAIGVSIVLLIVFRKNLSFKRKKLFAGLLISSFALVVLVRMQMNELVYNASYRVLGAAFEDLTWLAIIAALFYLLYFLLKRWTHFTTILLAVFCLVLFASILFSLMNIEIVRQIGKPLNYQWLYYSDFLQGTDAKNAMAYKMTNELQLNIILIVISAVILGVCYSLLPNSKSGKARIIGYSLLCLIFLTSFYQYKSLNYDTGKISNPELELLSSMIMAEKKPKLFSMAISKETEEFIEKYHTAVIESKLDTAGIIDNIVLFVFESTPTNFVSLYDSTYNVTPNLAKWKKISTVFNNMYAHIPSTSNSMATMISGVYPLINFKSIINEFPKNALPSITTDLQKLNWQTAFFSSADLSFGNMGDFAREYDFVTVDDSKSILCDYKRFTVTNTLLDGIDDRCITNRYFQWFDSVSSAKKFSMLWTNQTHYPYFVNTGNEAKYVSGNEELNRYLNGLKTSDEAFGMLMDGLEKRDRLKNTLVIVVADHGEAFGTHGQTGHGTSIYEENVKIPGIFYNPVLCKGENIEAITQLIDIAPTIAHVVGIPASEKSEGRSMFEKNDITRSFFICPYSNFLLGTRSGDWKYIYNATSNKDELYNLKEDPHELTNLSEKHPEIVKKEFEMLGGWAQYHNKRLKEMTEKK